MDLFVFRTVPGPDSGGDNQYRDPHDGGDDQKLVQDSLNGHDTHSVPDGEQ